MSFWSNEFWCHAGMRSSGVKFQKSKGFNLKCLNLKIKNLFPDGVLNGRSGIFRSLNLDESYAKQSGSELTDQKNEEIIIKTRKIFHSGV